MNGKAMHVIPSAWCLGEAKLFLPCYYCCCCCHRWCGEGSLPSTGATCFSLSPGDSGWLTRWWWVAAARLVKWPWVKERISGSTGSLGSQNASQRTRTQEGGSSEDGEEQITVLKHPLSFPGATWQFPDCPALCTGGRRRWFTAVPALPQLPRKCPPVPGLIWLWQSEVSSPLGMQGSGLSGNISHADNTDDSELIPPAPIFHLPVVTIGQQFSCPLNFWSFGGIGPDGWLTQEMPT